jgi:hypothetical protein
MGVIQVPIRGDLVEIRMEIWKWRFCLVLAFPARHVEMTSSSLVEIRVSAISTCPPFPPLRGTSPPLNMVAQPRP